MAYEASRRAEEIDKTILELFDLVNRVKTLPLQNLRSLNVELEQTEGVWCYGLDLLSAVLEYLQIAISYFESQRIQ